MVTETKTVLLGHVEGSVVECLPLDQAMVLESWDRVPHWVPYVDPSPSACVSHE